jgi:hypothetical protein
MTALKTILDRQTYRPADAALSAREAERMAETAEAQAVDARTKAARLLAVALAADRTAARHYEAARCKYCAEGESYSATDASYRRNVAMDRRDNTKQAADCLQSWES